VAIIPLARPLPIGSSDLPEGRSRFPKSETKISNLSYCFGRAALLTPPYLILHREEFAWPRMSPHAPVRSYIKPLRAAPFHPSPDLRIWDLGFEIPKPQAGRLVCFLLHLSSSERIELPI